MLDLASVWFLLLFARKPLLLFGASGVLLITAGMIVGVVAFWLRFVEGLVPPAPLSRDLARTVGFLLFGFGLVAEMIAQLRAEVDSLRSRLPTPPGRELSLLGAESVEIAGATDGGGRTRILSVVGTRPEAIKMAPVVDALWARPDEAELRLALTGQHTTLVDRALETFGLVPDYELGIMREGQNLYDVAHACLRGLRQVVEDFRPDALLCRGTPRPSASARWSATSSGSGSDTWKQVSVP